MRIKLLAGCAFLLNTIFFATYYSVAKEALERIDPIVFTFFEMVSLAPVALVIILWTWRDISRAVLKRGLLLGSVLCLALFTIAIALKYTTATSTAFFPALNGFMAAFIAWVLFREPLKGRTWVAGALSLGGAGLLIVTSSAGNWRGTLIAFLGGLFYTFYIFLCDHEQKEEKAAWALFGVELLSTAIWASLVVLLFGNWEAVHPVLPKDIGVVLYVSLACTFMPTLITVLLQKHISPITVSFIYILEPVLGALIAYLYLRETLPVEGYIGGALVVLGAIIQTWGTIGKKPAARSAPEAVTTRSQRAAPGSWISTQLYPGLSCILGALLLAHLGGTPPASWHELYAIWPQMSSYTQDGQGTYVTLLLVQSGGWLIAWIAVLLMGCLALYHTLRRLFQPVERPRERQGRTSLSSRHAPERPVLQPTRRVRTAAHLSQQSLPQAHTSIRSPEQQPLRPRTTVRLSEQQVPRPRTTVRLSEQQVPHPRTNGRLPEQQVYQRRETTLQSEKPTWYGQAVWQSSAGPETPLPPTITGPLQYERLQASVWKAEAASPLKYQASLERPQLMETPSLERLDA